MRLYFLVGLLYLAGVAYAETPTLNQCLETCFDDYSSCLTDCDVDTQAKEVVNFICYSPCNIVLNDCFLSTCSASSVSLTHTFD